MKTHLSQIYGTSIFSLFIILILSACCLGDKAGEYEYKITNSANSQITIEFETAEANEMRLSLIHI